MPVNGLPIMLERLLNNVLQDCAVSSFKFSGYKNQTTLVLRFDDTSMAVDNGLSTNPSTRNSSYRRKPPSQVRRDNFRRSQYYNSRDPEFNHTDNAVRDDGSTTSNFNFDLRRPNGQSTPMSLSNYSCSITKPTMTQPKAIHQPDLQIDRATDNATSTTVTPVIPYISAQPCFVPPHFNNNRSRVSAHQTVHSESPKAAEVKKKQCDHRIPCVDRIDPNHVSDHKSQPDFKILKPPSPLSSDKSVSITTSDKHITVSIGGQQDNTSHAMTNGISPIRQTLSPLSTDNEQSFELTPPSSRFTSSAALKDDVYENEIDSRDSGHGTVLSTTVGLLPVLKDTSNENMVDPTQENMDTSTNTSNSLDASNREDTSTNQTKNVIVSNTDTNQVEDSSSSEYDTNEGDSELSTIGKGNGKNSNSTEVRHSAQFAPICNTSTDMLKKLDDNHPIQHFIVDIKSYMRKYIAHKDRNNSLAKLVLLSEYGESLILAETDDLILEYAIEKQELCRFIIKTDVRGYNNHYGSQRERRFENCEDNTELINEKYREHVQNLKMWIPCFKQFINDIDEKLAD